MADGPLTHEQVFARVGHHRIESGDGFSLSQHDPNACGEMSKADKAAAQAALATERKRIVMLQRRLYAESRQSLLVVMQAIDTGGKDSTIRRVFRGVNPQGVRVDAFKQPTTEELAHDPFWRYHRRTPARGMIGVFNRSHYEEVIVVRVKHLVPEAVWLPRYQQIVDFEEMLAASDTHIIKLFLHISRDEQKERLQSRLDDPEKHWKFSVGDLAERERWDAYQQAFEDAIARTARPHAPWYVVPANRKWYRDLVVSRAITETLERMDPRFPEPEEDLTGIVIPE